MEKWCSIKYFVDCLLPTPLSLCIGRDRKSYQFSKRYFFSTENNECSSNKYRVCSYFYVFTNFIFFSSFIDNVRALLPAIPIRSFHTYWKLREKHLTQDCIHTLLIPNKKFYEGDPLHAILNYWLFSRINFPFNFPAPSHRN